MNIVIVENEPKIARLLVDCIEKSNQQFRVLAICASIQSTIQFIQECPEQIDMYFMDVHLNDGLCFEIFKQIKIEVPVVFCTSFDLYMLEAFKSNGIDYILKPFSQEDIELAFKKVQMLAGHTQEVQIPFLPTSAESQSQPNDTFLLVQMRGKTYPVSIRDIAIVSLENDIVQLYTQKKEKYALFKPLDDIEKVLDANCFFRINRQMIVNRASVVSIQPCLNRKVTVNLSVPFASQIIVSRLKVSAFVKWLENRPVAVEYR
jgi:DNA-binding LytR/AlgR family response regulator